MYRTPPTTKPKKVKHSKGSKRTASSAAAKAPQTMPATQHDLAAGETGPGEPTPELVTSTPLQRDVLDQHSRTYTRSESALLRIQTTIRAASAARTADKTRTMSEPAEIEKDGSELCSSFDDRSQCSVGAEGGGLLSDLPRLANATLQSAKTALESSGNRRRDIKETLVGSLQTLYEMVLRLADSRNRHMLERQRAIVAHERRLASLESANTRNLRAVEDRARREAAEHRKLLDTIAKDVAAQRSLFVTDFQECLERMRACRETSQTSKERAPADRPEHLTVIQGALDEIRASLVVKTRTDEGLERETLVTEIRKLRAELQATLSAAGALGSRASTYSGTKEQFNELKTSLSNEMGQVVLKLEAMDAKLQQLGETTSNAPVVARLGKMEELLQSNARELRSTTIEGLERVSEEIAASTAMQYTGLNLREEFARELESLPAALEDDKDEGWQRVGKTRRRDRKSAEPTSMTHIRSQGPPRHTVIVESVDPRHTSDDVATSVRSKMDVVKMGIGVNSIRKGRGQKVLIGCDSEADQKTFRDAVVGLDIGLLAKSQPLQNPLLKFVGVTADMSDDRIKEALVNQNKLLLRELNPNDLEIRIVRRTKGRIPELVNIILRVNPALWTRLRDQKIRLGFQVIPVYDQSPVIQCFKCLEFGHVAKICQNETVCGYCTETHDTRTCKNRSLSPICRNCQKAKRDCGHPAYSTLCLEWQKWDKLTRSGTNYSHC